MGDTCCIALDLSRCHLPHRFGHPFLPARVALGALALVELPALGDHLPALMSRGRDLLRGPPRGALRAVEGPPRPAKPPHGVGAVVLAAELVEHGYFVR